MEKESPVIYQPEIFSARTETEAREIILTTEEDKTSAERWETETASFAPMIIKALGINHSMRVLDFGCGIGRLSRPLIELSGCQIIGVDISQDMLHHANHYVFSNRFSGVMPNEFDELVKGGLQLDVAVACWVLQHCLAPEIEILRIKQALIPNGKFFCANTKQRCVPTNVGWHNDGISLEALLAEHFELIQSYPFPTELDMPRVAAATFINLYQKK